MANSKGGFGEFKFCFEFTLIYKFLIDVSVN